MIEPCYQVRFEALAFHRHISSCTNLPLLYPNHTCRLALTEYVFAFWRDLFGDHQIIFYRTPRFSEPAPKEFLSRQEKRKTQVIEALQTNNLAAENLFARKQKAAVAAWYFAITSWRLVFHTVPILDESAYFHLGYCIVWLALGIIFNLRSCNKRNRTSGDFCAFIHYFAVGSNGKECN